MLCRGWHSFMMNVESAVKWYHTMYCRVSSVVYLLNYWRILFFQVTVDRLTASHKWNKKGQINFIFLIKTHTILIFMRKNFLQWTHHASLYCHQMTLCPLCYLLLQVIEIGMINFICLFNSKNVPTTQTIHAIIDIW